MIGALLAILLAVAVSLCVFFRGVVDCGEAVTLIACCSAVALRALG
jgi:hypothetical protein